MISYLSVSARAHSVNDQTQLKKKKKKMLFIRTL